VPRSLTVSLMLLALGVLVASTAIGLVTLWPDERTIERPERLRAPETEDAEVVATATASCRTPGREGCVRVTIELLSGSDEGERSHLTVGEAGSEVAVGVGDRLRVYENRLPAEAVVAGARVDPYTLADFERRTPLLWLAAGFVLVVLVSGRVRGLRALLGLAVSVVVILLFVVPAILSGEPPEGVALVGALAIMLATIPLAHGAGAKALAACLGTGCALLLTLGLADAFTDLAHLTGLSSDEAIFLRAVAGDVSIQGLLLAGMVIGALGVLDDLTVSQASTVMALRAANPRLPALDLFRRALSVGHDHIAATVNTLVLAYAGASLPVLLVFSVAGTSVGEAVNSEAVAEQIVAMLVGSIGLIAAVPITTGLAALLAVRLEPNRLARESGGHAHAH
jgi:uncharacterized membrane protein